MLFVNKLPLINNFTGFEYLILFFGLPILLLLLIMKIAILITIKFHQNKINQWKLIDKSKIIICQFLLLILAQSLLFFFPIQEMIININLFDMKSIPVLTTITTLHLGVCFSFFSSKNNYLLKVSRYLVFGIIIAGIILQFNFTMIQLSKDLWNNLIFICAIGIVYYLSAWLFLKMFHDNFTAILILVIKSWKTLIHKTSISDLINNQQPVKAYGKTKLILLTWNFEQQNGNTSDNFNYQTTNNSYFTQKMLWIAAKKNLVLFLISQLISSTKKTIQDLKTLINGWIMRAIK